MNSFSGQKINDQLELILITSNDLLSKLLFYEEFEEGLKYFDKLNNLIFRRGIRFFPFI